MLIFILPTSYPNQDNPVANSFIFEQVKALSAKGCKVVVLNIQKQPSRKIFSRIDRKIFEDFDEYSVIVRKKQKTFLEGKFVLLNQFLFDRTAKKLFHEATKKHGMPDVIYAHFYSAGVVAIDIKKTTNIPVVIMEHSGALMGASLSKAAKKLLKKAVIGADTYIATTERLKEKVIEHTNICKDIEVIPNIVDDIFDFSPITHSEFSFFSVARLDKDKRVDLVVEAFCKAFTKDQSVKLRIGGNGPEYDNIKRMIEINSRQEQIELLGRLERLEVVEEMRNCSVFVLPSRHETFGIVWREALCVGRPVITTDHGGFSNNDWCDKYGTMIPCDNIESLVVAMKNMKEDYGKYNLELISRENIARYSPQSVGDKLLDVLERCMKEKTIK